MHCIQAPGPSLVCKISLAIKITRACQRCRHCGPGWQGATARCWPFHRSPSALAVSQLLSRASLESEEVPSAMQRVIALTFGDRKSSGGIAILWWCCRDMCMVSHWHAAQKPPLGALHLTTTQETQGRKDSVLQQ